MADYTQMWKDLNINLEAHDQLMNVLSQGYSQLFLSQKDRPDAMQYFDFVVSEIHGLRIQELVNAKEEGRKVIGSFCVYVPEELVLAFDAVSVGLCTGAELASEMAEQYLPRNTCALIKSAFGFKLAQVCPYMEVSDMIVGENTCDGKKKSYEQFNKIVKNLYVMDLPQIKSETGRAYLKSEYERFIKALEELTGKKLDVAKLKKSIAVVNAKRQAVTRLAELRAATPVPVSGLDALLINQIYFNDDPERFTSKVNELCDELEKRIADKQGVSPADATRLLVSGCPMAVPNWKIPALIEGSGAVIAGEELCTGERGFSGETEDSADSADALLDAIVDRYFNIHCAVFTPNSERLEMVKEMYKRSNADGVLLYNLQFCQPYQIEDGMFENMLEEAGIPVLTIDTDYSQEDMGQLSTRVEAFIERIKN